MKSESTKTDYKAITLCVLAAIIFWLMNALNKDGYSEKISFPLKFVYDDSLYVPTQPLPEKIFVNVSGNGWDLLRKAFSFDVKPVMYPITKPMKTKYLNTSTLQDSLQDFIKGIRVNNVVSDRFELEFDRKISKIFTVKVDSSGIPLQERFVVSSLINVNPRTVTLVGPESVLAELGEYLFVKVPGKRIHDNFDEEIRLTLPNNPYLKVNHERILVSFEVSELLK
jgi:YbbR domain-containing protein